MDIVVIQQKAPDIVYARGLFTTPQETGFIVCSFLRNLREAKAMNRFKIVPLFKEYAKGIRDTRIDDFGNEVIEQVATGYGPCRVSLKPFAPGKDQRLFLVTHRLQEQMYLTSRGLYV